MTSLKLLLRFAIVGGLVLLLLIPLLLIRSTINERERYRDEAVERVSQSWAGEQSLIGPVRVLPWTQQREVRFRPRATIRAGLKCASRAATTCRCRRA